MPDVHTLIVIVNFKRVEDTIACLKSLSRLDGENFTVALVDNSPQSTGGVFRDCVASGSLSLRLILVDCPGNPGFAGGNNAGVSAAVSANVGFDYVWFLNNDTEVAPNCLTEMRSKFKPGAGKIGICGSTMVYFHDKKTVQALGGSVYKPLTGTMYEIGNGTQWPHPVDEAAIEATMSYVCGASMLVSAQLIKDVGLMQEDYFLFYEEIDWCTRAKKAGYQLAYASQAVVYHKEGAAIGTGVGAKRSLLAEYYGMRNKLMVTRRFFPWALPSVWLVGWAQVLRRTMQGRLDNAKIMAQVLCGLGRAPR